MILTEAQADRDFQRFESESKCYPSLCQIIRGDLDLNIVARGQSNAIHAHFPAQIAQNTLPVFELDPELGAGQIFLNRPLHHQKFLVG